MEPKSKVYINRNFKRIPQSYTGSIEESKTTYLNKYFSHGLNTKQMYQQQDDANSRKIYVNPNFKAVNNTYNGQGPYASDHYIRNYNNNIHLNQKVSNTIFFVNTEESKHSPNYEMLQNINAIYNHTRLLENSETNCIFLQNPTDPEVVVQPANTFKQNLTDSKAVLQPVNNFLQAPLSKSRYCIVRKKKEVSQPTLKLSLNNNIQIIPQNKVNNTTGSSTSDKYAVSINQKPKVCNITPQKVTKIKISKYKTIPISYLKSNSQVLVTNKINPSNQAIQPYNKVPVKNGKLNSSLLATYSKNRFKFVKSKILVNSITDYRPVSKTSPLKLKRNLSLNKSKINVKAKFKINNIPCRLFTKYGKCLRKDYGKCEYLHDKKHVSLCRKFLKGICHDIHCALSHELSAKKVPTCYFYLKGMCTKEHCPYGHIKLSETTKICEDFIKGYCEKGDECPFRHVKIQEIKNSKHSKLNVSSKNQQKSVAKNKNVHQSNHKKVFKKNENKTGLQEKSESDCRYYDDAVNNEISCEMIKPTRCKLGTLPSFIQL